MDKWQRRRASVLERDQWKCHYCGSRAISIDHMLPRCRGGTDEERNLVAACLDCNSSKGGRTADEFIEWRAKMNERMLELVREVWAPWTDGLDEREIGQRLGARGIVPAPGRKNFSHHEVWDIRRGWRPCSLRVG